MPKSDHRNHPRLLPALRQNWRGPLAALTAFALSACASLDAMRRVEVNFDYISELAADLAKQPYRAQEPLPEELSDLDYDAYRKIKYNNNSYLWKDEGLPFALGFFHLGFLYADRVKVHEFTPTHEQHIRYLSTFFEFEDKELEKSLPSSLDYAGVRISSSVGTEGDYREVASFLGASYFRATGYNLRYGASARGIAIDSGLGKQEQFPKFVELWLGKPLGNAKSIVMYALLDGPSVTGAYEFVIRPGEDTVTEVRSRIFVREASESFGIAPLTSMFWRGENRKSPETDYRPEVHDSDGLLISERDEDPLWRVLDLGERTRLSYFGVDQLSGFGLLQRDRSFDNYQDMEAEYHKRPSVWVETRGDWGKGFVKLVELPTSHEFDDNIVVFWEPTVLPEKGDVLNFEYAIHWSAKPAQAEPAAARVAATRVGEDQSYPGSYVFVVDFEGEDLGPKPPEGSEKSGKPDEPLPPPEPPEMTVAVDGPAELVDKHVTWNPYLKGWRAVLRLKPNADDLAAVELRCQLLLANGENSEVWAYQWTR